jgi:hypothetical protein
MSFIGAIPSRLQWTMSCPKKPGPAQELAASAGVAIEHIVKADVTKEDVVAKVRDAGIIRGWSTSSRR